MLRVTEKKGKDLHREHVTSVNELEVNKVDLSRAIYFERVGFSVLHVDKVNLYDKFVGFNLIMTRRTAERRGVPFLITDS